MPHVQAHRQELAVRFAADHGVVLVLKGRHTVVSDGRRVYLNDTGNPGMATGGTGDVLTGLTTALLGQESRPFAAARLAVYLHGLAGDLARDALGETSLIATDLLDHLPRAFQVHQASGRREPADLLASAGSRRPLAIDTNRPACEIVTHEPTSPKQDRRP